MSTASSETVLLRVEIHASSRYYQRGLLRDVARYRRRWETVCFGSCGNTSVHRRQGRDWHGNHSWSLC